MSITGLPYLYLAWGVKRKWSKPKKYKTDSLPQTSRGDFPPVELRSSYHSPPTHGGLANSDASSVAVGRIPNMACERKMRSWMPRRKLRKMQSATQRRPKISVTARNELDYTTRLHKSTTQLVVVRSMRCLCRVSQGLILHRTDGYQGDSGLLPCRETSWSNCPESSDTDQQNPKWRRVVSRRKAKAN